MAEGPADAIDDVVARTQEAMVEASAIVLAGFQLRSEAKVVRWPDQYMDGRGREFWGRVMALLPAGSEVDPAAELGLGLNTRTNPIAPRTAIVAVDGSGTAAKSANRSPGCGVPIRPLSKLTN